MSEQIQLIENKPKNTGKPIEKKEEIKKSPNTDFEVIGRFKIYVIQPSS
jgi:hypothetical protein